VFPVGGAVRAPPPDAGPVEPVGPVVDVVTVVVVPELAEAPAIPAAAPPVASAAPTIAAVKSLGLVMCFGPPGSVVARFQTIVGRASKSSLGRT
jgi:hypothetical protein